VGEDGNLLSNGQKQKMALARAILKNAPIYSDEATKSVDTHSRESINKIVTKFKNEKTFGYEAIVQLVGVKGNIMAKVSAIATNIEKGKESLFQSQIKSLAVTRASAKAYRTGLGWLVRLSGYADTPNEEMDNVKTKQS
jgi:ABC-type thiamine transport system ATPase subunit